MGIAERRTREKEELRAKIMDAASELFVMEGFQNVSIRKIAEKIEYAPSTIYLYFTDKNKLIVTIVEETFRSLADGLENIKEQDLNPMEALFAGMRLYVRFGLEHPHHYYLAFCSLPNHDIPPEECRGIQEAGQTALAHLREALERCLSAGLVAQQDLHVLTQALWMMIHGLTAALITKDCDPEFPWADTEQLIEKTMDVIKTGILVPNLSKNGH